MVKGLKDKFFVLEKSLQLLDSRLQKSIQILSPFDNITIQRERLKSLFNFSYKLECYVPKLERKLAILGCLFYMEINL